MEPVYNDRAMHQPLPEVPARSQPSELELAATCEQTVALVLAINQGIEPLRVEFDDPDCKPVTCDGKDACAESIDDRDLVVTTNVGSSAEITNMPDGTVRPLQVFEGITVVGRTVELALRCHTAGVAVLAGGDTATQKRIAAEAEAAAHRVADSALQDAPDKLRGQKTQNTPPTSDGCVRTLAYCHATDRQATREACEFDLFSITKGVLDYAFSLLEEHPHADSVILLSCDQVRLTPSHIFDVCHAYRESTEDNQEQIDIVSSWITWLNRTPLLISRRFLEQLNRTDLTIPRTDGIDRPLPSLGVKEIVFGEEKLAANTALPPSLAPFFADCTLSAREAINIARAENADDQEKESAEAEAKSAMPSDAETTKNFPSVHQPQIQDEDPAPSQAKADNCSAGCPADDRSAADKRLIAIAHDIVAQLDAACDSRERIALEHADAWARRNRSDFPLLRTSQHEHTLAYLDSAATTQRPFCMLQAQATFDTRENANVYRGVYELSAHATTTFNDARKALEDHIGAERRQTVFTANTTASCNLVAQAWGEHNVCAGDVLLTSIAEHHSNLLPWLMLAQRKGARLEYIPVRRDGRLDLDVYAQLLEQHPKIVCVSHMSNMLGLENPVRDMADAAHAKGARFFLDAAQTVPHMPINVQELHADFVAFSAHKMYGPMGIGGLWIAPEAFDEMDPVASGGGAISHVSSSSYYLRAGAIQYELGTPPISQAIGWAAALRFLDELGMENVAIHTAALTRHLIRGLHAIEGVTVWGDHSATDGQHGLVSFSLAGIPPAELGSVCGKLGVAIRSGGHCALPLAARLGIVGTARASLAVHTTQEDIEALLVAVEACRQLYEDPWKQKERP